MYENVRGQLISGIQELQERRVDLPQDGYQLAADQYPPQDEAILAQDSVEQPTDDELKIALRVVGFLQATVPDHASATGSVIQLIKARFRPERPPVRAQDLITDVREAGEETSQPDEPVGWARHVEAYHKQRPNQKQRYCYICKLGLKASHALYKSMCRPCGDFNLAGSALSQPARLQLAGKTAMVTGARVNLGYHTVLRLLRCGARVVASTRYPNDAALRYASEPDSGEWEHRLKIIGADFRAARDVFALVEATRTALKDWGEERLDILINNAAQTLTDSVTKEERAVYREQQHETAARTTGFVCQLPGVDDYRPRLRGGIAPLSLFGSTETKFLNAAGPPPENTIMLPDGVKDDGRTEIEPYFKSSWVQSLSEFPYEDLISAHAVNTFVPLILCRELLQIMGMASAEAAKHDSKRPLGYVINVSSREGIFEAKPDHSAKRGKHVHTNMTKAALNMMTHTEAGAAWMERRVAMNSVDPGYMSAAPEMDTLHGGERPIDWEDGAGRLLWPVAIGEIEGQAIWGRFLKHYGAVDVDSKLSPE